MERRRQFAGTRSGGDQQMLAFDEAGAPVEVMMSCYRADRYRYMATLVRGRGEPFRWQYKSHA